MGKKRFNNPRVDAIFDEAARASRELELTQSNRKNASVVGKEIKKQEDSIINDDMSKKELQN